MHHTSKHNYAHVQPTRDRMTKNEMTVDKMTKNGTRLNDMLPIRLSVNKNLNYKHGVKSEKIKTL